MGSKIWLAALWVLATSVPIAAMAHTAHTSDAKLVNATVTGLGGIGRDFEFLDDKGKLRRVSDLEGKVVAVFFGFTNCPDACPSFLAKASAANEMLGEQNDKFEVVFVTIDPERDKRETLSNYLKLFGNNIIGARIPGGKLPELLSDFAISNQITTDSNGQIAISHSVGAFLFDTGSVARVYLSGNKNASDIVDKVHELLESNQ